MWAERILKSSLADTALSTGAATTEDLQRIADAWRTWANDDDGWMSLLHGELIVKP
jgi:hypothetical protein